MAGERPAEIKALAGARALPPLMVVLFHYGSFHHYVPAAAVLGPPVMKGYLWVDFFFALSGFVLTHAYAARANELWRRAAFAAFVRARLARLYPVHLVTLLSIAGLMAALRLFDPAAFGAMYEGPHAPLNTPLTFIANLFLVQAWNIVPDLTWNAPAWFVSAEFLLCLAFPLFLVIARGGAWRGALMIAAGAAWLIVLDVPSHVGLDITFDNGIFRGLAGFAIGTGIAMLYRAAVAAGAAQIPEWAYSTVQAAILLFLVWAIWFSGADHTPADIWTALAEDALIPALAFDRGALARLFAARPMLKLGEWSYGIYMGQYLWLQIASASGLHATPRVLEPFVLLLICIVWGALLARLVEQPANAALRLSQRKQTGRA